MRTIVTAARDATPGRPARPRPTRSMIMRDRVLAYVVRRGTAGATDEEISHALGMDGNTARPRRIELVEDGRVAPTGRFRPTLSGRRAMVWAVSR